MKKKNVLIIVGIIVVILVGLSAWKISTLKSYNETRFMSNTNVNGVDCSNLTVKQAKAKLTEAWNEKSFKIKNENGDVEIITNLDFAYDISDRLDKAKDISAIEILWNSLTGSTDDIKVKMEVSKVTSNFRNQFNDLEILERPYTVKTRNAYVDLSNTDFKIVEEVQGDNLDKSKLRKTILKNIANGKFTLNYKASDFYQTPSVTKDAESLLNYQDYCKKYLTLQITYELPSSSYTLSPKDINEMIYLDDQNNVKIKNSKVQTFVANLAAKYNTVGRTKQFKGTKSGIISVSGGNYGYAINQTSESNQLAKILKAGKDVTRTPIYSQKPYGNNDASNEIGSNYVEVDLARQHVWVYKSGKIALSTDVVTGNLKGDHGTPTGVYYIYSMERDAKLVGENDDGTDYETPVKYWMPFNLGIGLHDANWRSKFGGKIYRTDGSHGCVNMPTSAAARTFSLVSTGFPVVVHY